MMKAEAFHQLCVQEYVCAQRAFTFIERECTADSTAEQGGGGDGGTDTRVPPPTVTHTQHINIPELIEVTIGHIGYTRTNNTKQEKSVQLCTTFQKGTFVQRGPWGVLEHSLCTMIQTKHKCKKNIRYIFLTPVTSKLL